MLYACAHTSLTLWNCNLYRLIFLFWLGYSSDHLFLDQLCGQINILTRYLLKVCNPKTSFSNWMLKERLPEGCYVCHILFPCHLAQALWFLLLEDVWEDVRNHSMLVHWWGWFICNVANMNKTGNLQEKCYWLSKKKDLMHKRRGKF